MKHHNLPIPGLAPDLQIHTIFCIGQNYVEHVKELNSALPDVPVVFLKPVTTVVYDGSTIVLPAKSREVHHEIELVVAIGKKGKQIPVEQALDYVTGYGVGIDVTARDLQNSSKKTRGPWAIAKGFDTFAPLSSFVPADRVPDPGDLELRLRVNGEARQQEHTGLMIFPVDKLISFLSEIFTLHPGDLIFTGTPAGVSPLRDGDVVQADLGNNLCTLSVNVKRSH